MREGDRQAPEGFYNITPAQINPNSQFYVSFNMGYPNTFNKAHARAGAHLMVHGDCSSRGCYAMTDNRWAGSFRSRANRASAAWFFQVQAYPFRMTPANFAERNNPNVPFWRMLKEGRTISRSPAAACRGVLREAYVFNPRPPQNLAPANSGIKLGTRWGSFRDEPQPVRSSSIRPVSARCIKFRPRCSPR